MSVHELEQAIEALSPEELKRIAALVDARLSRLAPARDALDRARALVHEGHGESVPDLSHNPAYLDTLGDRSPR